MDKRLIAMTTIYGPAHKLHDLWIDENAADGTLVSDGDPWTIILEAKRFNVDVAKVLRHDNPLFTENGATFLAAYMASKLIRGSGSVGELVERISEAGTILSDEAALHTGPIAETLHRAAGLQAMTLQSSLESTGFMAWLEHPVSMANGKIEVRG